MQNIFLWLLGLSPKPIRPFLELIRFEKPTGTALMFWPFAWGLTLAAYRLAMPFSVYIRDLAFYLLGAAIVRGAACTVNDIMDRGFDAQVERTKGRPLPSGRVTVSAASIFLVMQYALAAMYFSGLKSTAFMTVMLQLLPLLSLYPLLKRVTHWPQAYLGFGMNFGLLVSWSDATGKIDARLMGCMLLGCWCWTMEYDTVYACQDRKDDVKAGVHSTAVLFGDYVSTFLNVNAILFVCLLVLVGFINEQGLAYYLVSCLGTACWLFWQSRNLQLNNPASCWDAFVGNGRLGWVIWGGLLLDYLRRVSTAYSDSFM